MFFLIWLSFCGYVIYYIYSAHKKNRTYFNSTPTRSDAMVNSSKNGRIVCSECGSTSFRNFGLNSATDRRRIHICNQCSHVAYRTTVGVTEVKQLPTRFEYAYKQGATDKSKNHNIDEKPKNHNSDDASKPIWETIRENRQQAEKIKTDLPH